MHWLHATLSPLVACRRRGLFHFFKVHVLGSLVAVVGLALLASERTVGSADGTLLSALGSALLCVGCVVHLLAGSLECGHQLVVVALASVCILLLIRLFQVLSMVASVANTVWFT